MPKSSPAKSRYLTREEIGWLLKGCCAQHVRLFVLLAINTGARKGALLDLKWPQVDMVNRLIYLNPPDREQTAKRRATVPINDVLFEALVSSREQAKMDAVRLAKRDKRPPVPPCPHVISYRNQPAINVKKGFARACARAAELHMEEIERMKVEDPARFKQEKPEPVDLSDVTPHTLRHTAGTLMAQAGVSMFEIAKMLGHSVAKTTELYAHHNPDYLRNAASILGRATSH